MSTFQDLKKARKKEKLDAIRMYHAELIKDLGISLGDFNMKYVYNDNGVKSVRIFENEFHKEKGFFFELINSDLDPIDPQRTVYRLAPSESYEEECEKVMVMVNGEEKPQYIVRLEELRVVNPAAVAISKSSAVTSSDDILKEKAKIFKEKVFNSDKFAVTLEDVPFNEMTLRDYFAIQKEKPVSDKKWLNDLIKSLK